MPEHARILTNVGGLETIMSLGRAVTAELTLRGEPVLDRALD
jgi:hypothetical protein